MKRARLESPDADEDVSEDGEGLNQVPIPIGMGFFQHSSNHAEDDQQDDGDEGEEDEAEEQVMDVQQGGDEVDEDEDEDEEEEDEAEEQVMNVQQSGDEVDEEEDEDEDEEDRDEDYDVAAGENNVEEVEEVDQEEEEEEEEEEEDEGIEETRRRRSQAAWIRHVSALKRDKQTAQTELAKYKVALAVSNAKLREHGIEIPEESRLVAGEFQALPPAVDGQPRVELNRVSLPSSEIRSREIAYSMQVLGYPDTTSTTLPLKLPNDFPHALGKYSRDKAVLAPLVQGSRRVILKFGILNRLDMKTMGTEHNLKPRVAYPRIEFELSLIYADTGEKVTLQNLGKSCSHLSSLVRPNVIGSTHMMSEGYVSISPFKMQVLSSMAGNRKFKFRLECIDPDLKQFEHIHAETVAFYSVARIREDHNLTI